MDKKYVDRLEAAARLGISAPTLNKLVKDGILTQYRPVLGGKQVLYALEEVDGVRYLEPRPVPRDGQEVAA